jgi:hypothetical protein
MKMITVEDLLVKIESNGSLSLTPGERTFIVEVFRAAALTNNPNILAVKRMIQEAHLEYCLSLSNKKGKRKT